jgi:hypothetical protein
MSAFRTLFFLSLFAASLQAVQIEVTKDADKIGAEDTLSVTISIDGSDTAPELQTDEFELRGSSRSSQIQVVNGQVSKKTVYQIEIAPKKIGKCSFSIQVGSESKGPFSVEVVAGKVKPQVAPQGNPLDELLNGTPWGDRAPSQPKAIGDDDVMVRNEISKNVVHLHEPVVLNTVLYTKVPLARLALVKDDNLGTLSAESVKEFDNQAKNVSINGQTYQAQIIRSRVIYPTLSGTEIIRGGVLRVEGPGNFWRGPIKDVVIPETKLVSKNFDEPNGPKKPASFNGAVGDFVMKVSLTPTTIKAHEPALLRIEITGSGNFHILPMPNINFSNFGGAISVKRSAVKPNFKLTKNAWTGSLAVEYYLIPEREGIFKLPGIKFSSYSPTQENYVETSSPDISINVLRGDPKETLFPGAKPGTEVLGEEVKFIKTEGLYFPKKSFLLEPLFIALHCLGLFILLTFFGWSFYLSRSRVSKAQIYNHSMELLAKAQSETDHDAFYRLIEEALQTYVTGKLRLPPASSISEIRSRVGTALDKHPGLHEALGRIKDAQSKRYAPAHGETKKIETITDTKKLLKLLEESFGEKKKN